MSAPRTYKTEAIILKHTSLGEADRILTLYTPNRGKIRAVARGARKTKSRIGGHVEPLTQSMVMISKGKSLDIVSQSQTLESFLSLKSDLWCTAQALYLVELVDAFSYERQENYPVYRLLLETLHQLAGVENPEMLFRYFEIQLMGHMGYQPQLNQCIACQEDLMPTDNFFGPVGGGVLCPDCAHTESFIQSLSVNALKVLRLLQRGDWGTAGRLKLAPQLAGELQRIIQGYIRYLLEKDLKSTAFLHRLRRDCFAGSTSSA